MNGRTVYRSQIHLSRFITNTLCKCATIVFRMICSMSSSGCVLQGLSIAQLRHKSLRCLHCPETISLLNRELPVHNAIYSSGRGEKKGKCLERIHCDWLVACGGENLALSVRYLIWLFLFNIFTSFIFFPVWLPFFFYSYEVVSVFSLWKKTKNKTRIHTFSCSTLLVE